MVHLPHNTARTFTTYSNRKRQPQEHESSRKLIYFKETEIGLAFYTAGQKNAGGAATQDTCIQIHLVKFMGNNYHALQVFF